jgi:hypothetical protein
VEYFSVEGKTEYFFQLWKLRTKDKLGRLPFKVVVHLGGKILAELIAKPATSAVSLFNWTISIFFSSKKNGDHHEDSNVFPYLLRPLNFEYFDERSGDTNWRGSRGFALHDQWQRWGGRCNRHLEWQRQQL